MDQKLSTNKRGFTFIELLIVMAMLGMVMAAIYSLYSTHQKAAYAEDELVEVQQNLRIAVDSITRDVRMAGFLIPQTAGGFTLPIKAELTSNGTGTANDAIAINVLSTFGTYARIDPEPGMSFRFSPAGEQAMDFPVDSPDSVDMFNVGDFVRIVRTQSRLEPLGTLFTVEEGSARNAVPRPTIRLKAVSPEDTLYLRGDIITKVTATATMNPPSTITYCLGPSATCGEEVPTCPSPQSCCPTGQLCLMRIENRAAPTDSMGTSANPVAANMAGLQFRYLMDDNSESDLPASADFSKIRAVRVLLTGRTYTTAALSGGQPKVRQVESVIQLRNR